MGSFSAPLCMQSLGKLHFPTAAHACLQVKAVRVEGSQLVQQGDVLVVMEPSGE